MGEAFEGGDGVRAHNLRADEKMDAIDEVGGEEGCVEARAGLGEEGEDAFVSKFVEEKAQRHAARFGGEEFHADAASSELVNAILVRGDSEDDDVVIGGADEFAIKRHSEGGVKDDAEEGAASACQRRGWTARRAVSQVIQ